MMVLKFEEYINEGLWSKGLERAQTGDTRLEDGKLVHTSLGVDIKIHNPSFNYEALIKEILDATEGDEMGIDFDSIGNWESYSRSKAKDIKDGKLPYNYIINNRYVLSFEPYQDVVDDGRFDDEIDGCDEHDYIEIVKAIAKKFEETKIEKPNRQSRYDGPKSCVFILMDEDETSNYEIYFNEYTLETYWDDFKEFFEDKFPEMSLVTYSYRNYAATIGMEIDYDSLVKYQEVKDWVKDYFEGLKENQENEEE